jgi:hypothetical protein
MCGRHPRARFADLHQAGHRDRRARPEEWLIDWDRSLKTKTNYHGLIHGVFAYAVKRGYLTANPAIGSQRRPVSVTVGTVSGSGLLVRSRRSGAVRKDDSPWDILVRSYDQFGLDGEPRVTKPMHDLAWLTTVTVNVDGTTRVALGRMSCLITDVEADQ